MVFSLLFGTFFSAFKEARASFLSSLLGEEILADSVASDSNPLTKNSQNIDLLQANTYPSSVLSSKEVDGNLSINIISDNALLPMAGPLSASGGFDIEDSSSNQVSVYVVRKGDSISKIADMFGVSVSTILAANDMKKGEKLVESDVLFILPISGLEHTVTKGQTLQSIAKLYKADIGDIALYNGITEDSKLVIGDKLMIPGGEMADEGGDKPVANLSTVEARDRNYYATSTLKNVTE